MRHKEDLDRNSYSKVDVQAVWPNAPQLVPMPVSEVEATEAVAAIPAPAQAAPDVPAAVGGMLFAAYAALVSAFALATAGSAESIYAITISALFVVAFFSVPRAFMRIEPKAGTPTSLDRFMREGLHTLTGHSSGRDALIQMLIVPVLLTFAALAMGIAVAVTM